MSTTDPTEWIKASRSTNEGNCVEMRRQDEAVQVRDTKDHGQGPTLTLTPAAFAAWVQNAREGHLDHLI